MSNNIFSNPTFTNITAAIVGGIVTYLVPMIINKVNKKSIDKIKQSNELIKIIDKLDQKTEECWSQSSYNEQYKWPLISSFKEISCFISDNDDFAHLSNSREFLFDLLTIDMEDNDIFQLKRNIILTHKTYLFYELKHKVNQRH